MEERNRDFFNISFQTMIQVAVTVEVTTARFWTETAVQNDPPY
jgi:hypothetical protein